MPPSLVRMRPPPVPVKIPAFVSRLASASQVISAESIDRRIRFIAIMFFLVLAILAVRAFDLTVLQHGKLKDKAQRQYLKRVVIPAHRGRLLDRHGRTLAISLPVKALSLDVDRMKNGSLLAKQLAPVLGQPLHALERRLNRVRPHTFPVLQRRLPPVSIRRIQQLENPALFLIPETQRFYPMGEVTSHLLGFTHFDGQGQEGLERSFEKSIKGFPGASVFSRDRLGRPLPMAQTLINAQPGSDMVLSIDSNVQYIAYRALLRGVTKAQASGGVVVVLNPNNGDIYAMVNQPGFNPNNLGKSQAHQRRNRALADAYEPGSTFKVVTVAAALDVGVVTPSTLFDVEGGTFRIANRTIRDFHRGKKWLTVTQILVTSSNVGAAKIGLKMGNATLNTYLDRLGFGRRTGIGVYNESPGSLPDITAYREVGLASRSYGYGLTATPLQIAMATAAVVNGGKLYPPRVLLGQYVNERWVPSPVAEPIQVIKSTTSATMRAILALVVEGPEGTAPQARIPGYGVAGKTGTARKAVGKQGYVKGLYFASFVGFVPVNKPQLLIYVGIDEPKGRFYGGQVAAPVFQEIAQEVLPLFSIFPEKRVDPVLPGILDPSPELTLKRKKRKPDDKVPDQPADEVARDVTAEQLKTAEETAEETAEAKQERPSEKFSHILGASLFDALRRLQKEGIVPHIEGHGRVSRVAEGEDGALHLVLE